MPTALYLQASGHPALRLCNPTIPCVVTYNPALMNWERVQEPVFDDLGDDATLIFDHWIDDAGVWPSVTPPEPELPTPSRGDGYGGKRPLLVYTGKRKLEAIIEIIEDIEPNERTSIKRAAIKKAREAIKAVEVPPNYQPALDGISRALAAVSRSAGEYQAFIDAAEYARLQMEALLEEIEAKRLKRRREEEMLIWLLH